VFDHPFSQFVSYGSTDQRTVRNIQQQTNGLLIPGTVAAFQKAGTGGFVLTMSALADIPYVIDSRFPLFQQQLYGPKKSHIALAKILGIEELISIAEAPTADLFTTEVVDTVAKNWTEFNSGYTEIASEKFAKYAERLGEELQVESAHGPRHVLAPYFMADNVDDGWWAKSTEIFERTTEYCEESSSCIRVVAAKTPDVLGELLISAGTNQAVVWVNNLNEMNSGDATLAAYGNGIKSATEKGIRTFALYGGFFSVLMSSVGLGGSSHGIGYGEHRDYRELPQSGPAPKRYYMPRLHRYVSQEFAYRLWQSDPSLSECDCEVCQGELPVMLDYHPLMRHSVLCRTAEIDSWVGASISQNRARLIEERNSFREALKASIDDDIFAAEALLSTTHLDTWIDALKLVE
jgi:hypothetical protein